MTQSTDRIERKILLKASRARVWRALSNAEEFGSWFGVKLKGQTFAPGSARKDRSRTPATSTSCSTCWIERVEPERLLSWRWHPAPWSAMSTTRRSRPRWSMFELEDAEGGTLLSVVESGFDKVPPERRLDGVPHEQRRLGRTDEEHRESMSLRVSAPLRSAGFRNAAPVFAALGDETRLRLVAFLCSSGAKSIAQLTSGTDITRQAVTKHLQRAGECRSGARRAGRARALVGARAGALDEARRSLELIAQQWDHALRQVEARRRNEDADAARALAADSTALPPRAACGIMRMKIANRCCSSRRRSVSRSASTKAGASPADWCSSWRRSWP